MDNPLGVKHARPTVRLSSVTYADVHAMARLCLLAFENNEYESALNPHRVGLSTAELLSRESPPEENRLRRGLVAKDTVYIKASVQTADNEGNVKDTIVGWAKWTAPPGVRRRSAWEWLWSEVLYPLHQRLFRPPISTGLPPEARRLSDSQRADTFGPGGVAEGREHWYLHMICVDPAWRRTGVGGALIDWGMTRAREMDTVVYLQSSPAGRPFYIAKGFRVAIERPGEVNGVLVKIPAMIWEPRSAVN